MGYKLSDICTERRYDGPTPCRYPECTCVGQFYMDQPNIPGFKVTLWTLGLAFVIASVFAVSLS